MTQSQSHSRNLVSHSHITIMTIIIVESQTLVTYHVCITSSRFYLGANQPAAAKRVYHVSIGIAFALGLLVAGVYM